MPQFTITASTPSSPAAIAEALAAPSFSRYTDHIAYCDYTTADGWANHSIRPFDELKLHPATGALHFGQEIFEGLKAYRHKDDSIWLFRPELNAARFARSAQRLGMAPYPPADFVESVSALARIDQAWVPSGSLTQSLYLRPLMFATEAMVAPHASRDYTYLVLATPAGTFYQEPLNLWITSNYSRAGRGGTGAVKCAGNYAAAFAAEHEALEHGCGQVLWLDAERASQVEECGTMNFFAISAAGELITPALNGSILPGVTRDSLLHLARAHGLTPVKRELPLAELLDGLTRGTISETFACGTAAVVSPIVGFKTEHGKYPVGDATPGKVTKELKDHLEEIQHGLCADSFGWLKQVC